MKKKAGSVSAISRHRLLLLVVCCEILLLAACKNSNNIADKKMIAESDIVFSGTVAVVHSSLSPSVEAENGLVVTIDEILSVPPGITVAPGDQITLQSKQIGDYKKGDSRIFYARIDAVGDNIAASETGSRPKLETRDESARLIQSITKAKDEILADKLNERIAKADLVVSGTIKSISPLEEQPEALSEHNPDWRILEIDITENLKGGADKIVRILYPGSNDVAYRNYPKPVLGKEWLFILNRSDKKEAPFQVTNSEAIVTAERYKDIRNLLKK